MISSSKPRYVQPVYLFIKKSQGTHLVRSSVNRSNRSYLSPCLTRCCPAKNSIMSGRT